MATSGARGEDPEQESYGVIQKPTPRAESQEPRRRKSRNKQKKSVDDYNYNKPLPPVPVKNKALQDEIKGIFSHDNQNNNTSQDNPLYDGVIILNGPRQVPLKPVHNQHVIHVRNTHQTPPSAGETQSKPSPGPRQKKQRSVDTPRNNLPGEERTPIGQSWRSYAPGDPDHVDDIGPVYELAGPILPSTYAEVPADSRKPLPPQPQYTAPRQPAAPSRQRQPVPDVEPGAAQPPTLPSRPRAAAHHDNTQQQVSEPARQRPVPKPRSRTPDPILVYEPPAKSRAPILRNDAFDDGLYDMPEPPPRRQPASSSKQPANSSKQPANISKQPADSSKQPEDSSKQPANSSKQPANNSKQPADSQRQRRTEYIYDTPVDVDAATYAETFVATPRSRPDIVSSLDSVIIDGRFYNYMCQFRNKELNEINQLGEIIVTPIRGKTNDIEMRFSAKRSNSSSDMQNRFLDTYSAVCAELRVESFIKESISDIGRFRNDVESKFECLCVAQDDAIEVLCTARDVSKVREVATRYQAAGGGRQQLGWPVGYTVAQSYSVYFYSADITRLDVDAIVNGTDEYMKHSSGTARSIAEVAGPKLTKECKTLLKKHKKLHVTQTLKTTAGDLPCRAVFHTVGPKWPKGSREAEQDECRYRLLGTFESALAEADAEGMRSVALSPIGADGLGVPPADVAKAIVDAILSSATKNRHPRLHEIHIVDVNDNVLPLAVSILDQGGSLKAPTGQAVTVSRLKQSEIKMATIDVAGYQKIIAERDLEHENQPSSLWNKLLCGGGKKYQPKR